MEKKNTEQMPSFAEQVERIVNEDSFSLSNSHLLMGQTPEILEQFGFDISLPMLVSQNKVRNMMAEEPVRNRGNAHGLERETVVNLPEAIAHPAIVMRSRTRPQDSIVITTDMLDNMQRPVIAAMRQGMGMLLARRIDANILTSAYGKDSFLKFINTAILENRVLYADIEKCHSIEKILSVQFADNLLNTMTKEHHGLEEAPSVQFASRLSNTVVSATNISKIGGKVNRKKLEEQRKKSEQKEEEWKKRVQAARAVPIEKVIGSHYTLTGSGKVLSTKEHDSLKIFLKTNSYYRYSVKQGGTAIDFLVNERGMKQKDAIIYLSAQAGYIETPDSGRSREERMQKKAPFCLPEKNADNKRVYAYLAKVRRLDGEIIRDYIKKGLLYESADMHNCVFVGKDVMGEAKAGYLRGTYSFTSEAFKGNVPGSDKRCGIYYPGKPGVRTLRCFEAPIDMMSFQQIYPQDETHKLALCGVDCTALGQTLKDHTEILEVILCLDNDKAGKKAANELRQSLEERGLLVKCEFPPMGKDWNEALEAIVPKKAAYKASGDALER